MTIRHDCMAMDWSPFVLGPEFPYKALFVCIIHYIVLYAIAGTKLYIVTENRQFPIILIARTPLISFVCCVIFSEEVRANHQFLSLPI